MKKVTEGRIIDLCYLCSNFPIMPEEEFMLPRDVEVAHLADKLESNNVVFLDGKEGIGVTTTLALFAKTHSFNCISYFYDGFTTAWLSPDAIEENLVTQFSFYLYNDTQAIVYPQTKIQSLIVKISQKIKQSGQPLYFVFDGLHLISKEESELLKVLFNNLPWGMAHFIFSGRSENYYNLLPPRIKKVQANDLLSFSRSSVIDYFKRVDGKLSNDDIFRLCEITQNEASKIDYIRKKHAQMGSMSELLEVSDSILSDLYVLEVEKIENNANPSYKILLALIAFSTALLTEDLIGEILNLNKSELTLLLQQSSDYINVIENRVQYKSSAFRKYMRNYLSKLKTEVEILILNTYEKYGVTYWSEMLPIYKSIKRNSIIPFLSANNVEKMHERQQSHASLNVQYEYGFEIAKSKEKFIGDAFRFAIARSTSNEIEKNEIWDSEIEALIAHGRKDDAIELAQSIYLKEDKLKALIQIVASCDSLIASEKDALKLDIDRLCDEIVFEQIPNKAIELAKILIPVDFKQAMNIIDKIAKNEKNRIDMDIIYAAISMSVNDETIIDSKHEEFNKFDMLKSKIQNESLKEMTDVMKSVYADKSVEETLKKIEVLKPASKQIYFLKYWIPEHKTLEHISKAVEYAINLLINDSYIDIPKVSILCNFAVSLPYIDDQEGFEKIIRLIDSIEASIKTPTQDYVSLKLIVIESYIKFDKIKAKSILDDLYLYVCDLDNKSTMIDCLSLILAHYDKLGDRIVLEKEFMSSLDLLNQIENSIKESFAETAYHFKIIQEPIKNLVTSYPSFLKDVVLTMNTEERRSKAYLYASIEYVKQTEPEKIKWAYLDSLVNGVIYNSEQTGRVWMYFSHKLADSIYTDELLKEVKARIQTFCNIESEASRCYVLVYLYLWLYRNIPTDKFTTFVFNQLYKTWQSIQVPWSKIDIGFHLAKIISICNTNESYRLLSEIMSLKHRVIYSSASDLTALLESIDLYTRSIGMLIKTGNSSDKYINDFSGIISKLGAKGEEFLFWSKICMNYYIAGEIEKFRNLVNEKILKDLNLEDYSMRYRKHLVYNLAPVLYLYSPDYFLENLTTYPKFFINACLSNIGRFILYKYPYSDEIDDGINPEVHISYQDATILISLTRHIDDDSIIFKHIECVCRCIMQKKIENLSTIQREHIYKEFSAIVEEKLPTKQGIQHDGYKIACRIALAAINYNYNNKGIWDSFKDQISKVANKADQAFLYFYSLGYMSHNSLKTSFLEEGYRVASSIKSGYDKFTRFNMCLDECLEFYRSQFPSYYKQIAQDLKGDNDTDLSYGDKMVDLAYQFNDERLVSVYMDIHDDDPVRIRYKMKLQKKLESTKRISDVIKQSGAIESLSVEECDKCYTKQLNSLLSGKTMTKDVWAVRDTLYPIYNYSISETKSAILFFMETVFQKQVISGNMLPLLLKMNEALLFNVKMVMALSTRTNENLERIYRVTTDSSSVSDSMIRPGEKSKAIQFILEWFRQRNCDILQIVDPYFSPDDLLLLKPLFDIKNKLKVRILTHHKYANISDYRDCWMQSYDEITGKIDIVSVRFEDKPDDGPLHDRYWILTDRSSSNNFGIKLNSLSGLGNKESDIVTIGDTLISDILKIWNFYFVDGEDSINGHTLIYEKIYIGK